MKLGRTSIVFNLFSLLRLIALQGFAFNWNWFYNIPITVKRTTEELSSEDKNLAIMMMPGKKRKLYNKIMHGKKRKATEVLRILHNSNSSSFERLLLIKDCSETCIVFWITPFDKKTLLILSGLMDERKPPLHETKVVGSSWLFQKMSCGPLDMNVSMVTNEPST